MADAQFFRVDAQFFWVDLHFFAVGLLLAYKLCIFLLLDYFHPRNDGFVYNAYKLCIFLLLDCFWPMNSAFFAAGLLSP